MTSRRAALLAGGTMLLVYVATLAPSVTFWDAGEFIAAARVLGIPHPPGTPLFVVLLSAWARVLWFLPFALATNFFSAVCTAGAVGLTAWWSARATRAPWVGVACGLTAGAMSSVWLNATETEVYAASLAVAMGAIAAADVAGRTRDRRWRLLAAYLVALAIPLHLSSLVVAPVVAYLAGQPVDGDFQWHVAAELTGVALFVVGISALSPVVIGLSLLLVVYAIARQSGTRRQTTLDSLATMGVVLVACSALAILVVRARHDPIVNQGNPATIKDLAYVVARRQYDVAGLWPRQAPPWLQLANWFEYADWQVALALAPSVIPSVSRVLASVAFGALAIIGSRWHRRRDRRTWRAVLLLFVCGSLGVIAYVNLKAGTSFAWAFIPNAAHHEARDRDYFFVLGFVAWGIWAGMGAAATASRLRLHSGIGIALAALPIALNWTAVSRRVQPEASMPREFAASLLDPLPPRAVLFVAGDNDSYPLWYAQRVQGRRPDVTVVTMPLLGAPWYSAELERRGQLVGGDFSGSPTQLARRIADRARALKRPVAVALTVPKDDRAQLGDSWVAGGLVAFDAANAASLTSNLDSSWSVIPIAIGPTRAARDTIEGWRQGRVVRSSVDPVHEYIQDVLSCPRLALQTGRTSAQLAKLDSLCNLR